jgi:hypothetical protein
MFPRKKEEGDMGLAQVDFIRAIWIDGGVEERFLEKGNIHKASSSFFDLSDLPVRCGVIFRIDREVNDGYPWGFLFQIADIYGLENGFIIQIGFPCESIGFVIFFRPFQNSFD